MNTQPMSVGHIATAEDHLQQIAAQFHSTTVSLETLLQEQSVERELLESLGGLLARLAFSHGVALGELRYLRSHGHPAPGPGKRPVRRENRVATVPLDHDLCDICGAVQHMDEANWCEAHNFTVCNACEAAGLTCPPELAPNCWRSNPRDPTTTDDPFDPSTERANP